MRSFTLLGAAAVVAAAPATDSVVNYAAAQAAVVPLIGPPMGGLGTVTAQTNVYNSAAAAATASAAASVTTAAQATAPEVVARAAATGDQASTGGQTSTGGQASSATSLAAASIITASPSIIVPSTCQPVSWVNTFAFTTDPACTVGPYEVGTYCGFINPEDPCAPQPAGYGPVATNDTDDGFRNNPVLHKMATSAVTPIGYNNTFRDLNAAVNANSYLGYKTLTSYDVAGCASWCDATNLCTAFNIWIEHDPAWNPDQCSCSTPASTTNFKCSIWGSGVEAQAATNPGQARSPNFNIIIVGSNGYEKVNNVTPPAPPAWGTAKNCSGAIHDHPRTCLGKKFFPGPFDVSLCADYANAQNNRNKSGGLISFFLNLIAKYIGYNPAKCSFFNAAYLNFNGVGKGTWCGLYAQQYDSSQATYQPPTKQWTVRNSWSYCAN